MSTTFSAESSELHRNLSPITSELASANHLSPEIYNTERVAALEKSRIFMTHWLCVARLEELPNVGDFKTMRIAGEPIVVTRESATDVTAFMNMCLHRGVEVAEGQGNTKLFHCPYHAWTYDVGGRLVGAPHLKKSERLPDNCRLPRLRTALWRGFVFVNFDAEAEPFESFVAPLEKDLWYYQSDRCIVADKIEFEIECNWKYITENLLDWYHASTVHANTFGRLYKLGKDPLPAKLLPNGSGSIEWDGSNRTSDPNLTFPKLPWLGDRAVYSAKGMIFPNMNFLCAADSLRWWNLWPVSPSRTHAVCYILLPESSTKIPDFEEKRERNHRYLRSIAEEDRGPLEAMQRAARSQRFVPGPLSHLEIMIHHLLNHYATVMTR